MFKIPTLRMPHIRALKEVFGKQPYLGVDIGTTSIKAVEVSPPATGGQLQLSNYSILETFGYLDRFNEAIQTSSLKLLEKETATYLKTLIAHSGFQTNTVIASLPSFSAFTTLIEIPAMSDGEIGNVMKLQAKQYIPLAIEQVVIDWQKVGERRDERGVAKYQILLISVVKEQVERYQNIFKMAGLRLEALEIEGISMARVLAAHAEEPVLIIDIGSRSTAFAVAQKGFFKFGGQTDFSGGSLTQVIANALNISAQRAEDIKVRRGLNVSGGEQELSTLMEPILDVIINEAKRIKANFESSYKMKIVQAILTGGGANLIGIESYFGREIGLPMVKANPFQDLGIPPALAPLTKELGPLLSAAVGLAVKGLQ